MTRVQPCAKNNPHTNNELNRSNPVFNNYPSEAYNQANQQPSQNSNSNENNLLPLIMSLLGKNDISKVFSQTTNKNDDKQKEASPPKDEILL